MAPCSVLGGDGCKIAIQTPRSKSIPSHSVACDSMPQFASWVSRLFSVLIAALVAGRPFLGLVGGGLVRGVNFNSSHWVPHISKSKIQNQPKMKHPEFDPLGVGIDLEERNISAT
jgi:hypothetical protein